MSFIEIVKSVNGVVNDIVWGPYMLVLLVGTGIFFTVWSKAFQVTKIKLWWQGTFGQLANDVQVDTKQEIAPGEKLKKIISGWVMLVLGIIMMLYSIISLVNYKSNIPAQSVSDQEINLIVICIISFILCVIGGIILLMLKYNITAKQTLEKDSNISPFQAVTTALASTVGTGNIAGAATAIVLGGPGAIFWMWVSGFFGMMTKYAEVVLAVKYREVDANGTHHGGPMYYIEKGLKMKWLAVLFAIFGTLATFGIGNMTQANTAASALNDSFGIPTLVTGIVVAAICALVIIGGIKRIAQVTEKLVPFMAVFYFIGGIVILAMNISIIPSAFGAIFANAFSFQSLGAGVAGFIIMRAMRRGIARGVFSNEAGLGSAPIAHAASRSNDPVQQGLWGVFEVFVDTMIICTITALIVLTSGILQGQWQNIDGNWFFGVLNENGGVLNGAPLVQHSFSNVFGSFGGIFVTIAVLCFAASTILGWSYYGQQCLGYLTKRNKAIDMIYKVIFSLMIIIGAIGGLELMWDIADTLNGLMAIPNLIALVLLSKVVMTLTKEYLNRGKLG